jgi:hypothetical protein
MMIYVLNGEGYFFKNIPEYPMYMCSMYGHVYSKKTNKILRPITDWYGYKTVSVSNENIRTKIGIHRLVALTFLDNLKNKPCVHHLNHKKDDNCYYNLEWATYSENSKYNYTTGGRVGKTYTKGVFNAWKCCRKIDVFSNTNKFLETLPSMSEATRKYGVKFKKVWEVCNGKKKTHKGLIFKYHISKSD